MNEEQAKKFIAKLCTDWDVEDQVAPWFRELAARELVTLAGGPTSAPGDSAEPIAFCEICQKWHESNHGASEESPSA